MIFVDDILTYFRGLGHAAEYGTLAKLNEQLTNVDYAASTDGMVAFVRLIGEQRTVDGHDQCDIAVHLSWLCPLDFDGETMLSTQEQAKGTLKAWINHLRGGNTVTVSEDARWQFGYDDFAENVAWVAVRVTLTAAAADCVPLVIPESWAFMDLAELVLEDFGRITKLCDGFAYGYDSGLGIVLCFAAVFHTAEIKNEMVQVTYDGVVNPQTIYYLIDYIPDSPGLPDYFRPYIGWYMFVFLMPGITEGNHSVSVKIDGYQEEYSCEFEI